MKSVEEYEKDLDELRADKQEIEALMARDLKRELERIQASEEHIQAKIKRSIGHAATSNGHAASHPEYRMEMKLADKGVLCLKSVDEAWLSPTEIGIRLVAAGAVVDAPNLAGHLSTALTRRMKSHSPDLHLQKHKGRYRYRTPERPLDVESTDA